MSLLLQSSEIRVFELRKALNVLLKRFKLVERYFSRMSQVDNAPKKRGRKPKVQAPTDQPTEPKIPKKRGRKPKGGKIIVNATPVVDITVPEPNIILHLKCGVADLSKHFLPSSNDSSPMEAFQFDNGKGSELTYHVIKSATIDNNNDDDDDDTYSQPGDFADPDNMKNIWKKLKELTVNLHTNNISDKRSACFWCTCEFDNPPIYIPKYELNDSYHCYGCFCSPECAVAHLFKEAIDTSTRFERYHLLNHLYCKIYDYEKNIKPAPNPYYTLNKYYGNLTIQEYRLLLKNERLLLVVDKPLTRTLPELHEDNDDFVLSNKSIPSASKYKLRRRTKQSKTEILQKTFNVNK